MPILQVHPDYATSGVTKLEKATIQDDPGDPGPEGCVAAKLSQAAEGQEVRCLHGVLCVVRPTQNACRKSKGRRIMASKQFGYCILVSLLADRN